jgi:predicted SAM-dependent methyltransferase
MYWKYKSKKSIEQYVRQSKVRKIQIGAGNSQTEDWLMTDVDRRKNWSTVYLDACQPFPIPGGCFDYVFSEHMIEHIPYSGALKMLQECHRILKPGGTIRIATPDLDVLLALKRAPANSLQAEYISWIAQYHMPYAAPATATHVINNAFRSWGHTFLFDEECLDLALRSAGFDRVKRMPVGISDDLHLRNIEMHGKTTGNEAMNAFETMVLEARKPDANYVANQ